MLGTDIHLAKTASLVLSQAHDFTRSVSEFIKHVLKPLKTLYIFLIYTQQKALQTYDSRWIFLLRTNHTNARRETRAAHRRSELPGTLSHTKSPVPATSGYRADAFMRCVGQLKFQALSVSRA